MLTDADIDRHIRAIIAREGGWVDDPDDSGGPTNYGITLAMWKAYCKTALAVGVRFSGADVRHTLGIMSEEAAVRFYRWYFRTQGLAELIDEFSIPDGLVPLVMDMRTLHSPEGCRKILQGALYRYGYPEFKTWVTCESDDEEPVADAIALMRIQYMLQVAERSPKDRKFVRGWMHRALKAIGLWPPKPEAEVREA